MLDFLDEIVNSSPRIQRKVAEETLIQDAVESLWLAMESQGINRAELARRLDTSPSNITQTLRGTRNMTLRSLAAIAYELGKQVRLQLFDRHEKDNDWHDVDSLRIKVGPRTRIINARLPSNDYAVNDEQFPTTTLMVMSNHGR